MGKIKTTDDLSKLRKSLVSREEKNKNSKDTIQIKVAMATCSIASGSNDTINFIKNELAKRNIEAFVTQTGCMGFCYAEPTVEVTIGGKEPVVFGYVDEKRADEIIEKYIRGGELVEGIIPQNYRTIDDKV
jgi:NADP-reducing hydrogenase subunit HndB